MTDRDDVTQLSLLLQTKDLPAKHSQVGLKWFCNGRFSPTTVSSFLLTPTVPVFSLNLLPPFIAPNNGKVSFLGLVSISEPGFSTLQKMEK